MKLFYNLIKRLHNILKQHYFKIKQYINMALTYKKLSELTDMTSGNIDATTKLVVTTSEAKTNNNLKVSDLIVDDLTTSNSYRGLSAKMGKKLQDEKAPIASPTFTGTVAGITKSMVGLGNVDNTSDLNKPISTATQTALNLKATKDNPILTGEVTLDSGLDGAVIISFGEQPAIQYSVTEIEVDALLKLGSRGHGITTQLAGDRINISTNPFGTIINLPEFADNAAALTGTLVDGDLYRTSTGQVMITMGA